MTETLYIQYNKPFTVLCLLDFQFHVLLMGLYKCFGVCKVCSIVVKDTILDIDNRELQKLKRKRWN